MKLNFDLSKVWNIENVVVIKNIKENVKEVATETNKKYILKIKKDLKKIPMEYELLNFLKLREVPVNPPMKTNNGELYYSNGIENYCLYEYLEGEILLYNYLDNNKDVLKKYGMALGKLHKILLEYKPKGTEIEDMNLEEGIFNWAIPEILKNQTDNHVKDTIETIKKEMKVFYLELPKQLIHRDPNNQNMLFKNGKLSGLIDFELCMKGFKAFDICYMMTGLLMEGFGDEENRVKWLDLICEITEGYESENEIEKIEKESFWFIFISIQLTFAAYFYSISNKKLAELNLEGLYWIFNNRNKILEKIK